MCCLRIGTSLGWKKIYKSRPQNNFRWASRPFYKGDSLPRGWQELKKLGLSTMAKIDRQRFSFSPLLVIPTLTWSNGNCYWREFDLSLLFVRKLQQVFVDSRELTTLKWGCQNFGESWQKTRARLSSRGFVLPILLLFVVAQRLPRHLVSRALLLLSFLFQAVTKKRGLYNSCRSHDKKT